MGVAANLVRRMSWYIDKHSIATLSPHPLPPSTISSFVSPSCLPGPVFLASSHDSTHSPTHLPPGKQT
ncbi:unnamed protein product [Periconia digitata]|uniref:Uncharacterized protein n=1 Tax=Periconia digitata TaxID=1303443 RepID=A0A9W4UN87_9PLEO|nr:unnamed protein product [Periconia digitata]